MRLDLFLKRCSLVKRRSEAKRACDGGIVTVEGRAAKASREVSPGQRVAISFVDRYLEVEILKLPPKNVTKSDRQSYYKIIRDESRTALDF